MDGVPDAPWVSRSVSPLGQRPSLNQPLTEKSSIDDIFLSLIRLTYDGEFSTDSTAVDNK